MVVPLGLVMTLGSLVGRRFMMAELVVAGLRKWPVVLVSAMIGGYGVGGPQDVLDKANCLIVFIVWSGGSRLS